MHPTASYLALRGCACLRLGLDGRVRIAAKPEGRARAIYDADLFAGVRLSRLGGMRIYAPADWSEFKGWDDITDDMIEQLLDDT